MMKIIVKLQLQFFMIFITDLPKERIKKQKLNGKLLNKIENYNVFKQYGNRFQLF